VNTRAAAAAPALERVRAALAAHGLQPDLIRTFPESTATAADAAQAIGTSVERIVKSLVFIAGDQPLLVLASGANRVDLEKLAALTGSRPRRATPDEVRQATGFAIGGVPPLAHASRLPAYVDRTLLEYPEVWAAAGTPNAVFPLRPADLLRLTNAQVADLAALGA
jgi:prolyl-tRNA editing enzyme YbaK/EbsC (Cys-tRNA(Pro) deacylase)